MRYLVTGAAGFIGFHLIKKLIKNGNHVIGIDNINDYYDVNLKKSRLEILSNFKNFNFFLMDVSDRNSIEELFRNNKFDRVIHLAAQAGVRYSLINPYSYSNSNLSGFLTILEACRHQNINHLIYASSSSVYGLNGQLPFSTSDSTDHPISLYAATKKANELMAHSYSHLYGIPTTGLRFFTVYGPWGRPDMALFKFTKSILKHEPIDVYNNGELSRDFTYVDDIVEGIARISDVVPVSDNSWKSKIGSPANSSAPYKIYNIGNGSPVSLMSYISALENSLGIKAIKNMLPMQPGDVYSTWADTEDLFKATGYKPFTDVSDGVEQFVQWYKQYYL
ncbi:NAD-dependent epimerase [Xenorhabdus szentirmaii]|uniref:NAD-dependent epimerase n=1 Tax=Xenorhabdus szentirmaii TaxID=290112 RepID=A0AAW3YQQ9_9GAMM|nr:MULTISPECIES: NAD-dependent epimerase [Xenorhabdus]MBD2781302.1 NAD-dependent epimerase [Xenorhabdus sp. 38]MBD2800380.1 NAD-dependent epimerase [Xenorhabdus sp. M]PHM43078.1 NAD dependent epimerase/dehydratase family protein [Xenorhabdus szentirmaii]